MIPGAAYQAPAGLRNAHLQSLLATLPLRRPLVWRRAGSALAATCSEVLDAGAGVRLLAEHTPPAVASGRFAVLIHGWEGSAASLYMVSLAARLVRSGFRVVRLNLRDHGDSHHLNPGIFHSCRLDEVLGALLALQARFAEEPLHLAGFSLGGNFALRVALRAPQAGITLRHVAAVCPVISPRAGLEAIEAAPWFYQRYFMHKWGRSLRRKQALYPESYAFSPEELRAGVRGLTRALVERYTEFDSVDAYLDGYSIAGERLAALRVPASILAAADDPIIPIEDFRHLTLPPDARLEITPWGGHCGFITDLRLRGLAEDWITEQIDRACPAD